MYFYSDSPKQSLNAIHASAVLTARICIIPRYGAGLLSYQISDSPMSGLIGQGSGHKTVKFNKLLVAPLKMENQIEKQMENEMETRII